MNNYEYAKGIESKCENNKGKNRVSAAKWKSCRSAKCIGSKTTGYTAELVRHQRIKSGQRCHSLREERLRAEGQKVNTRNFPSDPVIRTPPSNSGGVGSMSGQGADIPYASGYSQKFCF